MFLDTVASKEEAIRVGSKLFVDKYPELISNITNDLLLREEIVSTGIGGGVALPHIHKEYISDIEVGVLFLKEGVDYNSLDSQPVNFLFFILTSGNCHQNYLRFVAKLTSIFRIRGEKEKLRQITNRLELYNYFIERGWGLSDDNKNKE